MATVGSWFQVQQLAKKLFVPSDQKNAAWDFLSTAKFKPMNNLDLHFSKFIKNEKLATGNEAEFLRQPKRTHFIRSLAPKLMRGRELTNST